MSIKQLDDFVFYGFAAALDLLDMAQLALPANHDSLMPSDVLNRAARHILNTDQL